VNRCLHKLRAVRILLALLVLPGFVIRAAVPPGFMPVASRDTTLTMAICPGHAAQSGVLESGAPSAPGDHRPPAGQSHEAPCVFAATAGGAPPTFIGTAVLLPISQEDLVHPPPIAAPATRQIVRAHAPRAPPSIT